MNQQFKTKSEAVQNRPAELSDIDLEKVVGGITPAPTNMEYPNLRTAREAQTALAQWLKAMDSE